MKDFAAQFIHKLQSEHIGYYYVEFDDGRDGVQVVLKGINCSTITTNVTFDEERNSVRADCFSICNVSNDKQLAALECINILNSEYRWVTFSIRDGDIDCKAEIWVDTSMVAKNTFELLIWINRIIDEVCPKLKKAI
mgnify:CR=1 FL=1